MVRYSETLLVLLFCAGCGSKPAPNPSASPPARTTQASNSSFNGQTQQGATQPQGRIEARAILVPALPEKPKPPVAHEAMATIPGAQQILFAAASPTAEEIFVLAQTSRDTYGGAFFVVRLDGAEKKVETVMEGTNAEYAAAPLWSPDG